MLKHINLILLVLLILLPMAIYALNIYTINITSNIEIEKEKYIVTFDPNGGTVDPTEKEVTYLEPYGELPVPVYEGHTFTGWYTERENGDYVDKDTIVTIKGNHTLYAHWEEDIYKVKFDPNGGKITSSFSEKEVIYGHKYGELATAEREGYKFVGWYLEPDDTNNDLITEDSIVKITHDHTLYAHWVNADFVVTFDANGGETPVPQKKGITYQKPYGELATTKRVGYDFLGWYTEREGGEEVTSETIVTRAYDHTLYAHWKNKELIVTFDSNGGDTPVPTEKEVTYLEKYGELATTKRTGYKFLGWYTEKENGTLVTSETTVTNPENHTLYAHWDTIVITFDANGIAEAKVPDNKKVEYQKPYGELKDATCDNLEFIGWYLDPENEDNKITSETIVNIPNDHTLYAHWRIKVTFNANGEEDATIPDPVEYKFGETYGSNEGFVDASGSKKFKGWYTKENGGKLITSEDTLISDRNHTLYAHWESIKVTFNPNGGETPVPETKEVLYQKPYGELATVTRPGYTFTGWYTNKDKEDGEVEVTKDTLVSTYEDHTLYAHWKINRVNIVFNSDTTDELNSNLVDQRQDSMNPEIPTKKDYLPPSQVYDVYIPELTSGENNKNIITGEKSDVDNEYLGFDLGDDGKKVTWGDVYGELPTPTKDGYTFIGWFDKNGKEVTKDTIIEEDEVDIETGKLILSAHWSPNTYTATFDPVDGTLDNSQEKTLSKKVVYGKPIGVVPSASKFGYTFKGWYHEAYHEVEGTNEGVITENSDYDYPSDHTFTPIWHRNIYNLVYDANGGTVSPASKKVEVGNIYGILATPTKDGSAFTGWYTKREGGKKVTWETVTEQSDNDVTIYAHWKEGYVLVDYNTSYIYQEDTKLIGSTYGSMPTPTREGYSFAGWYTKENGGEKITENDVITSTNTINLYAHWEPNSYKVKFDANGGTLSDNIPEEITVKYADSLDLNKYTATLEGYTFGGWAENPNNQSGIAGNIYVQATTNEYTTLYAIYYKNLTINYAVPEGIENAISLSKTKSSCRIFSHENNCIIATPSFTNIGTTDEEKKISISGFKEKDAAEKRFKTNVQATITEDDNGKTFYAIPSDKKVTLRAYLMLGDKLQVYFKM